MPPSEIANMTHDKPKIVLKYNQTKAIAKTLYLLKLGNLMGVYNDKQDLHFFDPTNF